MLRPSYSELMDAVLQEESLDPRVVSRYTLVLAAAKRARQITDGAPPLTYAPTDRAVSIAVKELHEGKLKISIEANLLDGNIERLLRHKDRIRAISTLSKDDLREDLKDNYTPSRTYKLEDDDGDDVADTGLFQDDPFAGVASTEVDIDEVEAKEDFDIYADTGEDAEPELEESFDE